MHGYGIDISMADTHVEASLGYNTGRQGLLNHENEGCHFDQQNTAKSYVLYLAVAVWLRKT